MTPEASAAPAPAVTSGPAAAPAAVPAAAPGPPRRGPAPAAWRTAAREFATIVAGVLAALGAQAWWEWRQDRGRERDYLRQLLVDARENERRLDRAITSDSVTRRALDRLATALYAPGPPPPPDTMLRLFGGRAFSASDFQPITGTPAALLATGDIRLVRTDSLRARIVTYAATLDFERDNLRFYQSQAFGDAGRVGRAVPFLRLVFTDEPAPMRAADVDFARMRADPELAGVLFALQAANSNRLTHLQIIRDETRRLRRVLQAELGADAQPDSVARPSARPSARRDSNPEPPRDPRHVVRSSRAR